MGDDLKSPLNVGAVNDAMSENEYVQKQVRKNNLVEFFLNEIDADRYISTHLYGAIAEVHNADLSIEDASDIFNTSARSLLIDMSANNSFDKRRWIHEQELK